MNNVPANNSLKIYKFTENEHYSKNALREFLSFLRYSGIKGNICFSHASGAHSLHSSLSIKANLMLDAVANGLSKQHEDNFFAKLGQMSNTSLLEMIHGLGDSVRLVTQLNCEELEILAISKALLSDTPYVILDIDENNLKSSQLDLIKNAIIFEATQNKRVFLIQTKKNNTYAELVDRYIERQGAYGFVLRDNMPSSSAKIIELERPHTNEDNVYHFSLKKSA